MSDDKKPPPPPPPTPLKKCDDCGSLVPETLRGLCRWCNRAFGEPD